VVRELNPAERELVARQLSDLAAKAAIYRSYSLQGHREVDDLTRVAHILRTAK
jgi:hypothetical protein